MQYRMLGNTGLKVSEIGLGSGGLEEENIDKAVELINVAFDAGVNIIDIYSPKPNCRKAIGKAIKGRRSDFILQGQLCTVYEDGQYKRTRDFEKVKESWADLLEKLDTDYLDIGMIHYVDGQKDLDDILNGPIMEFALEQKKKGVIKHLGIGSHNPAVAMNAINTGLFEVLLFSVNPAYDLQPSDEDCNKLFDNKTYDGLINPDSDRYKLYELCANKGVGITVMKAYGGGDLLSDKLSPFGKALTTNQCLAYCLSRPAVSSIMVGAHSIDEMKKSLEYVNASDEQKDYSTVLANLKRFNVEGNCLYCGHCAPCSVGIDVAMVTKLTKLCVSAGKVLETESDHYKLLDHHASECIECGVCMSNCPFKVDIIENMRKAKDIFGY